MEDKKNFPTLFFERYSELYGEGLTAFLETMDRKLPLSLRVNTLKTSPGELAKALTEKGFEIFQYGDGSYVKVLKGPFSLASTTEHLQGLFYIQGIAEMDIVPHMGCGTGELVWDMCAAPGGKTSQIAEHMGNTGTVLASDVSADKIKALKNNLARLGVTNSVVIKKDARKMVSEIQFDRVLLDAPCTGSGIIRKDPSRKRSRTMKDIVFMQSIQKGLLRKAVNILKEGGMLLYSTCSLEPEENEMVMDWALNNLPVDLAPIEEGFLDISPGFVNPLGRELDPRISLCGRIHPHVNDTNGMFLAKLIKN